MSAEYLPERNSTETIYKLDVPYTICEVLVAVAAIIGNALVILVFWYEKKLRRRTKYYIISLAVADLLVGLVGIPFAILASVGLPKNLNLCLFTVSFLVVLCTISIFCLVAVSLDRYWAILHPMSYYSRNVSSRTTIGIIMACWVAGTCVGFLPLMGWRNKGWGDPHHQECRFTEVMDNSYLVFLYFATIIVPALIMAAFYTHIYTVVLHQLRRIVLFYPGDQAPVRSSGVMLRVLGADRKREVKATQNLSIIVLFFIICWIPLYTINAIEAFWSDYRVPNYVTQCCIILSHLNSSCNPFLYAYHLKDFRQALKALIYCTDKERKVTMKQCTTIIKENGAQTNGDVEAVSNGAVAHFGADFLNLIYIDVEDDEKKPTTTVKDILLESSTTEATQAKESLLESSSGGVLDDDLRVEVSNMHCQSMIVEHQSE